VILNEGETGVRKKLRKRWQKLLGDHWYNFVKGRVKSLFCHCGGRVLRETDSRIFRRAEIMLLGRTAATIRQDIVRFSRMRAREHNENSRNGKFCTSPCDCRARFSTWISKLRRKCRGKLWKDSLFFMSHFPAQCKKLVSLIMSFFGQFRLVSIVFGTFSVTCCLNIAIWLGKKGYNMKNYKCLIDLCIAKYRRIWSD